MNTTTTTRSGRTDLARLIKRVPSAGPFSDKFLYHVTSTKNVPSIKQHGIKTSGTVPTFSNQNNPGKAFLTDAKGVGFWKQRVGEHLTHNHDDPPGVAVLRVNPVGIKLKPDAAGSTDAQSAAWYSETRIPAKFKAPRRTNMNTLHFSAAPLGPAKVDTVNAVIFGVSVITVGEAKGHGLTVDSRTLDEVLACARKKTQTPVKVDHAKSGAGAASVCGFLTNFRREGDTKLIADWNLLHTHAQTPQILETAQRMPGGVGLSVSFVAPDNAEAGKARCSELLSVDLVVMPACNPSGLFSAKVRDERPLTGVEKVRRVISASGRGAEVGAVGGLAARALLRRRGITRVTGDGAAVTGATVGALTAGALQWRRDSRPRDFAAHVTTILFENRATISRLIDATRRNVSVPVPGVDEAATVVRVAKKPLVRRIGTRLLKVGAGAGLGYAVGRKVGARAGAVTGAVAGLLFSSPEARATVRLAHVYAKTVTNL